jgi:hypothetical protein
MVQAMIGTTAFVEFDTNRYSVPTDYAGRAASIAVYPDRLEIIVHDRKIASHERSFDRWCKVEHPAHREKLLHRTPHAKYERIDHLMNNMGEEIARFLADAQARGEDRLAVAYRLFCILRSSSKAMLLSAVREANSHHRTIRFIEQTLAPLFDAATVYPQNASLLDISYRTRELTDYDELT